MTPSFKEQFYSNTDLTPEQTARLVKDGLRDADYGEFYQEIQTLEAISKDMGIFSVSSHAHSGFGFRYGENDKVGYTHSAVFNQKSLKEAIGRSRQVRNGSAGTQSLDGYGRTPLQLYPQNSEIDEISLSAKINRIDEIEAYIKAQDERIHNVSISYSAKRKDVQIITMSGNNFVDHRPLLGLSISITLRNTDGRLETGRALHGGPITLEDLFDQRVIEKMTKDALNEASTLFVAENAPAGEMDIVLSAGWSGVLLHEAVGHGLEGDFNRRNISVYSGKIGQKIASDDVTIIDQGDIKGSRGAIHFDDEGTPGRKNILVQDGILLGYMQDRQNAILMGVKPTGNGRRQDYTHLPMPRMTNTYFANGSYTPQDIISSMKSGLYIHSISNGQVNITSGRFNMNTTLAYKIKNGKITTPVKGATLMGDGATVIQSIEMIGNDLVIPANAGMCGKNGQSIPVGVGQPTIKVSKMKIGGLK